MDLPAGFETVALACAALGVKLVAEPVRSAGHQAGAERRTRANFGFGANLDFKDSDQAVPYVSDPSRVLTVAVGLVAATAM